LELTIEPTSPDRLSVDQEIQSRTLTAMLTAAVKFEEPE
jgi:hypothetical protein